LSDGEYTESLMPINYVMLAVISGIIGLVLAGFTGWHYLLASKGQTTIECLEKTRYLSPLRKTMQHQRFGGQGEHNGGHESYEAMERSRARQRYQEYLDEQDSEKLPSAFDLGRRRNLSHLFGPKRALWFVPICNTTGDGWSWDPSPKWVEARERITRERNEQQQREYAAGWGHPPESDPPPARQEGAARHYASYPSSNRSTSKADRILGRGPNDYADVSMENLRPRDDPYDTSDEEEGTKKPAPDWPQKLQKVGVVTNTLLGNTLARQKDDGRWDGQDDGID